MSYFRCNYVPKHCIAIDNNTCKICEYNEKCSNCNNAGIKCSKCSKGKNMKKSKSLIVDDNFQGNNRHPLDQKKLLFFRDKKY